jgi:hypothetical protein
MPEHFIPTITDYIQRGWKVIPIEYRCKAPRVNGWPSLAITETALPEYFDGTLQNVGVILGNPSGGLVDIDLDCPAACELADKYLPRTGAEFGHGLVPRSHRLYNVVGTVNSRRIKVDGQTAIELRSTGCQTVFPPSVHPNGEPIVRATRFLDPLTIDHTELMTAFNNLVEAI